MPPRLPTTAVAFRDAEGPRTAGPMVDSSALPQALLAQQTVLLEKFQGMWSQMWQHISNLPGNQPDEDMSWESVTPLAANDPPSITDAGRLGPTGAGGRPLNPF